MKKKKINKLALTIAILFLISVPLIMFDKFDKFESKKELKATQMKLNLEKMKCQTEKEYEKVFERMKTKLEEKVEKVENNQVHPNFLARTWDKIFK